MIARDTGLFNLDTLIVAMEFSSVTETMGLGSHGVDTSVFPSQRIFVSTHHTLGFHRFDFVEVLSDLLDPYSQYLGLVHSTCLPFLFERCEELKVMCHIHHVIRITQIFVEHFEFINANRLVKQLHKLRERT
jgi:hypothetical protein